MKNLFLLMKFNLNSQYFVGYSGQNTTTFNVLNPFYGHSYSSEHRAKRNEIKKKLKLKRYKTV